MMPRPTPATPTRVAPAVRLALFVCWLGVGGSALAQASAPGTDPLDSLKRVARTHPDDSVRVWALTEVTYLSQRVSLDSAKRYGRLAVAEARRVGSRLQRGAAHNDLASAHLFSGGNDSAAHHYRRAVTLREGAGDTVAALGSQLNLGAALQRSGKSDSAMVAYIAALRGYEAVGEEVRADRVRNNIGALYDEMGSLTRAADYYHQVLAFRQSRRDSASLPSAYINLGVLAARRDSAAVAVAYFRRGIKILEATGADPLTLAKSYSNLGGALNLLGEHRAALPEFDRAIALGTAINDDVDVALSYQGRGDAFRGLRRHREAVGAYREAVARLTTADQPDFRNNAMLDLSQSFAQLGLADSSNYYAEAYKAANAELQAQQSAEAVTEAETRYQTAQKERALAEARAARAEDQLAARQRTLLLAGGLGLTFLAGLVAFLAYRQQRLRNEQQAQAHELKLALARIEAQNELQGQRLRISRDLHDNIGAQLSFIISAVDNVRFGYAEEAPQLGDRLRRVSRFAGDTVRDLRDTVWAMNKDAVTVADLRERLANFVGQARTSGSPVRLDFDVTGDPDAALAAEAGMNVYRIAQEAVSNALKYADASEIVVALDVDDDRLAIEVRDDGRGFSPADEDAAVERGGGNGLHTMRQRAEELGAELDIISTPGTGTRVRLAVPLAAAAPVA